VSAEERSGGRPWTRDEALLADFRAGMHSSKIARKYGLNRNTVTKIAKDAGITRRPPRKEMARHYPCIDCGKQDAFRPNTRCPACMTIHKRAYNADRGHPERTTPAPRPQDDPDLPPYGTMILDDDRVQCHVCGRFFRSLASHIRRHGLSPDQYREHYEISTSSSLLSPVTRQRFRDNAIRRNLAALGTPIPEGGIPGRQPGQRSNLGARINVSDGIASTQREDT
jgi:hypothetical protein